MAMMDRQAAVAVLREQLSGCAGDPVSVLGPGVVRAAEAVRAAVRGAAVSGSGADLEVAHALGWYHWMRYQVLPEGRDQEDLAAATEYLRRLYPAHAGAVPEPLRRAFDSEAAGGPATGLDSESLTRRAIGLFADYQRTGELELLARCVAVFRDAVAATLGGHPNHAECLSNLGGALRALFGRTGELSTLVEAVQVGREAVAATPVEHPDRAGYLSNLGAALQSLFGRTGEVAVLVEAVQVGREAVAGTPVGHPNRAACLGNLGNALRALFGRAGELSVLVEAVQVGREAVAATPDGHADRAGRLNNFGAALQLLFGRTGELPTLVEAVQVGRDAVAATSASHPSRAMYLSNLGGVQLLLFKRAGELPVLVEAVQVGRDAVAATPAGHPDRAGRLGNLGVALRALFGRTGELSTLVEAVDVARDAVVAIPADQPDRAGYLSNLGVGLWALFGRTGELSVLVEAVQVGREAVAVTPDNHPDRAMYLNNLSNTLRALFGRTGELSVLVEAVQVGREAVAVTPDNHPDRAMYLNNLGNALRALFGQTEELSTLVEAVQVGREAIADTPAGHPDRVGRLSNLGVALQALFGRTGEVPVLTEAIQAGREAVAVTPDGHPDRAGYLSNLGVALQSLAGRTGDVAVLTQARGCFRAAGVDTAGATLTRISAYRRFAMLAADAGDAADGLECMEAAIDMIDALAPGSLVRADREHQLGLLANLAGEAAAAALHAGRPRRAVELLERTRGILAADTLGLRGRDQIRLREDGHGELADRLDQVRSRLDALDRPRSVALPDVGVVRTVPLVARDDRLLVDQRRAAQGELGDGLDQPGIAAPPDTDIDRTAPQDAQDDRLLADQRRAVHGELADGLDRSGIVALPYADVARTVPVAARDDRFLAGQRRAAHAELADRLDQERSAALPDAGMASTVPQDAQGDRLLADQRRAVYGELADQLDQERSRLDALDRPRSAALPDADVVRTVPQVVQDDRFLAGQRRAAHAEWDGLLGQIRALPGFADFLRTPPVDALARYAQGGPIVFVVASRTRADALILTDTPDPVRLVPLPDLTEQEAQEQANRLRAAYQAAGSRDLELAGQRSAQQEILAVLAWLWDVIAAPVLTSLGHASTPADEASRPRVWWCPVGVLSYLPLHAAGHHAEPPGPDPAIGPRTVPDCVVSSYTSTARALAGPGSAEDAVPATLIVPVPDLPGAALPGVNAETKAISSLIPGAYVLRQPTRATVLAALPTHKVAHFACHGHVDWQQPAESRLLLADYATNPLTLAHITALHLVADLAYLSACSTTVTAPRLADESLHITGAFHLAGYSHVIGTLWPIDDTAAAEIATAFYQYLTTDGVPRPEHAAYALHHATTLLRTRYPDTPSLWAAHIHTGR